MLKAEKGEGYHSPETLRVVVDGFAQNPQKGEGTAAACSVGRQGQCSTVKGN